MLIKTLMALLVPALVVTVLAGASCKRTQTVNTPAGDVEVTQDGSTVTVEDQEGTAQTTFGTGVKLPDNFPDDAPVYANANLTTVSNLNTEDSDAALITVVWTTSDARSTVADWYSSALDDQDWNINLSNATPEYTTYVATKGERNLTVNISEAEGLTNISLQVTPR